MGKNWKGTGVEVGWGVQLLPFKIDGDHNFSSSLGSHLLLVPLEGFPLSPFEETTAPGGKQKHNEEAGLHVQLISC